MDQENKTPEPATPAAEQPTKKGLSAQTIVIIIILALMIIIPLVIFLWKQAEIKSLKKNHEARITEITTQANNTIMENNRKNIETLTRVFTWAVRSEMLRQNMEQIDTYMTDLVKTEGMHHISVINSEGIVVRSTNKKYEGVVYPGPIAKELSGITEVITKSDETGDMVSICPVMGLDNRMGTLIITYQPKTNIFVPKEAVSEEKK
ncbi:MAG TPA: hypothetical protein PLB59_10510 [Bacteroidales bacterium]|nr:hypothetical protein [Bacteroidales bacterium]HPI31217.1 hypothetical protein [Bacteroidales bacterium]HQN16788.1 hypothetical protein [Bacteroidales bacterium]HQP16386.1 hypothetical protein [Bacteroidales bacterium]